MEIDPSWSGSLVRLNRKLSRAASNGVGVKVTSEEVDLLVSLGMMDIVGGAMAAALKAQADLRRRPAGQGEGIAAAACDFRPGQFTGTPEELRANRIFFSS